MNNKIEKSLYTDCGMFGLWDYETYKNIDSYDEWEKQFLEDKDIIKSIESNKFVPIYYHTDGCFQFNVKVNEELNERENKYVFKKSEDYLFYTNGTSYVSGIEFISSHLNDSEGIKLDLEKGYYKVVIYIIEWDKEPNSKLPDGNVSPDALPDFIVKINKTDDIDKEYRKKVDTFDIN